MITIYETVYRHKNVFKQRPADSYSMLVTKFKINWQLVEQIISYNEAEKIKLQNTDEHVFTWTMFVWWDGVTLIAEWYRIQYWITEYKFKSTEYKHFIAHKTNLQKKIWCKAYMKSLKMSFIFWY